MLFKVKFIVALLILSTFAGTFVESFSIPQVLELHRRDNFTEIFKKLCGGFRFEHPKANGSIPLNQKSLTVKNGDTIECVWRKDASAEVQKVISCDLYTYQGLMNTLWNKTVAFKGTRASAKVKIVVPKADENSLPKMYLLRSMGLTQNGPQCNCYSALISVTK